ncbi:TAF domain-containing protein [Aphelenchoides bicaudatus]|nr:TAF domain-containing protein [Aphelenchoides bicaudatus]
MSNNQPAAQEEPREEPIRVNRWDGNSTKYAIDDSIKKVVTNSYKWKEKHILMDIQLVISFIAVAVAGFGLYYDFRFPYPASSTVCAVCCISYFVLISVLQLYMMYIKKDIFFQAVEETPAGERTWCFSGEMQRYDDKYTLTVNYSQGKSSGSAKVSKSIASYVTEDGEILLPLLKPTMCAQNGGNIGFQTGTVQTIAERKGIQGLTSDSAGKIAGSVTSASREIIKIALRFQRAGRRKHLIVEDIDAAIRFLGLTPPFGYDSASKRNYRFAGALINESDVRDDREVELQPLLNAPLPKLPLAPVLRAHWLVIDGKQPATPENPSPETNEYVMSDQMPSTSTDHNPPILRFLAKRVRKTTPVQIKTTMTHEVSLEQQVFFKEIIEAIMGNDESKRVEALNALQNDCGLQSLLPRFSVAIAEGVRCNVAQHNLALLIYHMRIVQSLSLNKSLSLERALHELLPSILTCILSKRLCANPSVDKHWVLRDFSSKLLHTVCKHYAPASARVRVIKVLSDVFTNPNSSFTTLTSAVIALSEFGHEVVSTVIAPNADKLRAEAERILRDKVIKDEDAATKMLEVLNVSF